MSAGSTSPGSVLFFGPEAAQRLQKELTARGAAAQVLPSPAVVPPPDPRGWLRAVSELALFNWLLLPTPAAAEVLIESIGAPPGPTLRIATVGEAGDVLRAEGRVPEVEAVGLRAALGLMAGRLGRRQRTFVPHAAVGGSCIGDWLEDLGAEVVCQAAYGLDVAAEPSLVVEPAAAVLADGTEAEILAGYLRAGRLPATLPIASLDPGAADAAEDCGLVAPLIPSKYFGPFLDEALS